MDMTTAFEKRSITRGPSNGEGGEVFPNHHTMSQGGIPKCCPTIMERDFEGWGEEGVPKGYV